MTARCVRFEREGALGRLVLDRPPLNVIDIAMLAELAAQLDVIEREESLKVLVLAASGKAFCAGIDVADHAAARVEAMLAAFHDVVQRLRGLPMPTIALVHGAAMGGGLELAIACDLVLVRADAKLGQPEIRLGAFPPVAAALMPRMIGRQRALDIVLSGRTFSGTDAVAWGLAAHAWPADDFASRAAAYIAELLALSGPVLRVAKHAVAAWLDVPFVPALQNAEQLYVDELQRLRDAREGIQAFLEKRSPVWSNA